MSLLSGSVQPSLLTLLSSTSQPGLSPIFQAVTDSKHQDDSNIQVVLDNDTTEEGSSLSLAEEVEGSIIHPVIHIQTPDISKTYIQAGTSRTGYRKSSNRGDSQPLGIEIPWMGMHFRPLGSRPFSIEVGVVDALQREGVIRLSSFKSEPSIHFDREIPLLHLPLFLPAKSSSTLTSWCHLSIDLNALLHLFTTLPRPKQDSTPKKRKISHREVPSGRFASVSYVRVYANCRIRRIWFAEHGQRTLDNLDRAAREEWDLYAENASPR